MKLAVLCICAMLLMACGIPKEGIRPGGVVVVEVIGKGTFRVGGRLFFSDDLKDALRRLGTEEASTVEVLIPSGLLKDDKGESCAKLMQTAAGDGDSVLVWRYFSWVPHDKRTKKEVPCNVAVLA